MNPPPPLVDAIGALLGPLLGTLEHVLWAQRHLYPPAAPRLAEELSARAAAIADPLRAIDEGQWPSELQFLTSRLRDVSRQALGLVAAFEEAARSPHDPIGLYRAVRRAAPIQEALYPLAPVFEPVSRWFLDPDRRGDADLLLRLRSAALRDDDLRVGILHAQNDRDARGGFSLYVPETCDGTQPMPIVVALHGGSGHGRDFLWTWLRDARSRGALLLSPTSHDRTWSIMGGPDVDAQGLVQMLEDVAARYPVDRSRVLLTGMSDGATYALLCGLRDGMPFTHLAPACGVLHPGLLAEGLDGARGRPIYLIHGALDWMFPVAIARMSRDVLEAAGAAVVYREIEDLSHTYPREENAHILDWLAAA